MVDLYIDWKRGRQVEVVFHMNPMYLDVGVRELDLGKMMIQAAKGVAIK